MPWVDEIWYDSGFNIGGEHHDFGLLAHAPSTCTWDLDGSFDTVEACVGIEDGDGDCGTGAEFIVIADGSVVYQSGAVFAAEPIVCFEVSIDGATEPARPTRPIGAATT